MTPSRKHLNLAQILLRAAYLRFDNKTNCRGHIYTVVNANEVLDPVEQDRCISLKYEGHVALKDMGGIS